MHTGTFRKLLSGNWGVLVDPLSSADPIRSGIEVSTTRKDGSCVTVVVKRVVKHDAAGVLCSIDEMEADE